MRLQHPLSSCFPLCAAVLFACSSPTDNGSGMMTTSGGANGNGGSGGSAMGSGGSAMGNAGTTANAGTGGVNNPGGGNGAGGAAAGSAGTAPGGAGGDVSVAGSDAGGAGGAAAGAGGQPQGGATGMDDCGQPLPPMPITALITAQPMRYNHDVGGRPAAVDLSVPVIMGKLIIDLGVSSGGIYNFGVDRGFHTYGGEIQLGSSGNQCTIYQGCPFQGNDEAHNGDCRWNTFDGMPHGDSNADSPETSLSGRVQAALQELAVNAPGQGWDYFLDGNGNVRWSDVGITGYSHGAQSAALIAVKQCIWRAVSRSGPRDNGCGNGAYNGSDPPYNPDCMNCISDWIDETPASPISHFYGFVGQGDSQYGDIMFTMERMGFIGEPVDTGAADFGGSHRFFSGGGHDDFTGGQYDNAMQEAWSVPQENMDYAN